MNLIITVLRTPAIIFFFIFLACKQQDKMQISEHRINPQHDSIYQIKPFNLKIPLLDSVYYKNKQNAIRQYYQDNWIKDKINGSFLVAKNGQILFENYQGLANREKNIPITAETPIHLASISKVLTAAAVLRLIDAKKIDLNQKVNTILKTFPYPDITVKMLLDHRSGLKNYAYFTEDKNIWDSKKLLSNRDILMLLDKHHLPLAFKPDSKFGYCNTNYAILALIIEQITKKPYGEAMKKMIFEPLEMDHTFVFDYNKDRTSSSISYKANNTKYQLNYLDNIYGDKNTYSTPRDLLKFDLATYSRQFLNPELVQSIFKGYSYEHKGVKNYGLGIRMMEWDNGQKMFYHNGWWHGNTTSYVKLKNDTVAIIALSNKFNHKTYKVKDLALLFGDYPFETEKE